MANTALSSSTLAQLNSLSQLTIVRQFVLMLLIACAVALGVSVVLWSQGNNYTVLYSNLTSQDMSEITSALESGKLEYRIEPGTGYLAVPQTSLQETRLHLASLGLPRANASGFDMLSEDASLGTSNFIEQARYNRALEQELVKTIKLLRGVRDVRVHISIPKQSSFLRSSNKPSASVMLDVVGALLVSDTQIAGIAHLVASSVTGLNSEDVSIVDQKGNLLSKSGNDLLGSSNEQLKYTRAMEQEYSQRIIDILTPIVGPNNIRAQVTADLDFTVIETTNENFDPNSMVVRSEQTQEENRAAGAAAALPGALSPTPPTTDTTVAVVPAAPSTGPSRINATRNYEIDKSVSFVRKVPGDIRRLSVAVLVDLNSLPSTGGPLTPAGSTPEVDAEQQAAKITRLTQLVKDSIGYSETRGDSVYIVNERFSQPEVFEEPQIIQEIWESEWVPTALKQLAASIVILLLIFAVLKPALKSVLTPVAAPLLANVPGLSHSTETAEVGTNAAPKKLPSRSVYDENLSLAQNVVTNEPARAARMLKDWVASD